MERESAWKRYDEDQLAELEQLAAGYIDFISENKTEREFSAAAIRSAEDAGYESLDTAISAGRKLAPGDKVWATMRNKAVILVQLGARPLTDGMNILGAHIDSPRLDVKQNPLYESSELALMDTHYYGGIKHYQWVTVPLALHGVIAKKDGSVVDVKIGEDADDPVFCISDLLIHLANQQMGKKANEVVEGEALDILVGNRPLVVRDEDGEAKDAGHFGQFEHRTQGDLFAAKGEDDRIQIEVADERVAQCNPRRRAGQTEQQPFGEEDGHQLARLGADRRQRADLANAFIHRHQHHVHDADQHDGDQHDADE